MQIINGKETTESGKYAWGVTTSQSYLPLDNSDAEQQIDLPLTHSNVRGANYYH